MLHLKRFNPTVIVRILRPLAVPLMALAIFTAMGIWATQPPSPSTNENDFSTDRAMEHVRQIAREPHPVGSPAHGQALEYLLQQLRALPFDVQVQDATVGTLRLTNVLARQKSSTSGSVALLVAHYDSVPTGPGAGDDGAGVATLLETARQISRETSARNEVAFLFTDGEEAPNLPGSAAFVRDNAEFLKRVKVVLNFDARGNRGPVIMYETGLKNLELIRLLRSCPCPVATSFAQDVYRRMPNDTDFSNFLRAGLTGYNFAMIMGLPAYHRPTDTWENLDRRSLAHYGSYALTLARRLSQTDLDSLRASDDGVFFTLVRGWLVVYPAHWAMPLAAFACLLYGALVIRGLLRGQLRFGRVLLGILFSVLIVTFAAGATVAAMKIISAAYNGHWLGLTASYRMANIITLIFLFVAVLVVLTVKSWLSQKLGPAEMLAGALLIWLLGSVLTAVGMTGFSYLFLWPALFGTLALLGLARSTRASPLVNYGAMACTLVPCCLLFAPTMLLAYHALGITLLPGLVALSSLQVFLIHVPDCDRTPENRA